MTLTPGWSSPKGAFFRPLATLQFFQSVVHLLQDTVVQVVYSVAQLIRVLRHVVVTDESSDIFTV